VIAALVAPRAGAGNDVAVVCNVVLAGAAAGFALLGREESPERAGEAVVGRA
jgi:hypothetical protein